MGHVCYVCKKEFKRIWNTKWEKSDVEKEQLPPTGMTSEDKLCSDCYYQCPKLDSDVALERMKLDSLPEGITSQQCDWCQKEVEISQMELPPRWIQNEHDHCQCIDCGNIIENLTSTKLEKLGKEQRDTLETRIFLANQISDSYNDEINDIASGHRDNSHKQQRQSLELKILNGDQVFDTLGKAIVDEEYELAKKYFSNIDSNESETKVGSPNTMKPNEHEEPIKILKVRLAKGEITLEEFNKIKESLE